MRSQGFAIVLGLTGFIGSALAQSITDYPVPTADSSLFGIATGPDGALWFTEGNTNKIGRISTAGVVKEFAVPAPSFGGGDFTDITRGPDGAMWFGEVANVARIDTSGNVTHYRAGPGPQGNWIAIGPDGAFWYTQFTGSVGRMDPAGHYTGVYQVDLDSFLNGLAFASDGGLWVTVSGSPPDFTNLRHLTLTGQIVAEFTVPKETPQAITLGPDGALWFAGLNNIGRVAANGAVTLFPIPTSGSHPTDIISGPDGALWFAESNANKLGRITTAGVITEYPTPAPPSGSICATAGGPFRIAVGPDNGLWFTEPCVNKIGHLTFAATGTPEVASAIPTQGNGASGDFTFTFSDAAGWQSLGVVNVLINSALDGRKACYLAYAVSSSTLFLVDDSGDAGGPYAGSVALGNPGTTIQNSQCAVSLVSAAGSGSTLTLTLGIQFQPAFAGNLVQYLAARDSAQNNSGWQASGVWNAAMEFSGPIAVQTLTPGRANATAGNMETVSFTVVDSKGTADVGIVNLLVNNFIDGRQACYLAYVVGTNTLALVDDAGDAGGPFAGTMPLNGSAATIRNSQCIVSGQGSSVTTNGNQMTVTLALTFLAPLAGNRILWVAGRDTLGANNTGWQALGTAAITVGN